MAEINHMRVMHLIKTVWVYGMCAFFVAACVSSSDGLNPPAVKSLALTGSVYRSLDKHEMGLGMNGVAEGYWQIEFLDDRFKWLHSDVLETGRYHQLSNNSIDVSLSNREFKAYFYDNHQLLEFDGLKYGLFESP